MRLFLFVGLHFESHFSWKIKEINYTKYHQQKYLCRSYDNYTFWTQFKHTKTLTLKLLTILFHPEQDWTEDINQIYRTKGLPSNEKRQRLLKKYQELYNEILNTSAESEASLYQSSQSSNTLPERIGYGNYRKIFAEGYCKKIEAKFGRDGKKLPDMDSKVRR